MVGPGVVSFLGGYGWVVDDRPAELVSECRPVCIELSQFLNGVVIDFQYCSSRGTIDFLVGSL